jgi:hypothetical protein
VNTSGSPPILTPAHTAALLRASIETLRAEAAALGIDGLRWHPAPGEWCANEVVGHMIEAERRGFAGRIQLILEQPGRDPGTWDPELVARERHDCDRDGRELIEELAALREASLRLVEELRPKQLELSEEHPEVGTLRIIDLLHEWPHHDRAHVKQVLSNVQAYVWPHMGNAQRFSEID